MYKAPITKPIVSYGGVNLDSIIEPQAKLLYDEETDSYSFKLKLGTCISMSAESVENFGYTLAEVEKLLNTYAINALRIKLNNISDSS